MVFSIIVGSAATRIEYSTDSIGVAVHNNEHATIPLKYPYETYGVRRTVTLLSCSVFGVDFLLQPSIFLDYKGVFK